MSDIYSPKLGDTIPNWNEPAGPYTCSESAGEHPTDGSNPSYSTNADLPVEGDTRPFGGPGSSNSNPTPGKTGADDGAGAPMNPGLRPSGQPYTGQAL